MGCGCTVEAAAARSASSLSASSLCLRALPSRRLATLRSTTSLTVAPPGEGREGIAPSHCAGEGDANPDTTTLTAGAGDAASERCASVGGAEGEAAALLARRVRGRGCGGEAAEGRGGEGRTAAREGEAQPCWSVRERRGERERVLRASTRRIRAVYRMDAGGPEGLGTEGMDDDMALEEGCDLHTLSESDQ